MLPSLESSHQWAGYAVSLSLRKANGNDYRLENSLSVTGLVSTYALTARTHGIMITSAFVRVLVTDSADIQSFNRHVYSDWDREASRRIVLEMFKST